MLSMNLYHFLKFNRFQGLSMALIRRFAVQLLQALCLLHQNRIIHCDLKPENILLRQSNRSAIKVIDFGSSCFSNKRIYTYIQSRFYRAPEIMLGIPYSAAIDMWSFGCILVELSTGFPIFPGENEAQQLFCIMEYLGTPSAEVLARATRKKIFFENENKPKIAPDSKGRVKKPGSKRICDLLSCADPGFVRLVEACLVWDQHYRLTPEQAMGNEWILEGARTENQAEKIKENGLTSGRNGKKQKFAFE
jgi:dual specificity tyrosine-phosphorylation-regulated kinase 2/3/4